MLAYLIKPSLMLQDVEFGRAVLAVYNMIQWFIIHDPLLKQIETDNDFVGDDLSFFLQQCHLIVFFRASLPDPSLFFLTQVMIAHCVRSVSKPEHCLAISCPTETKHLFEMTPVFLADECFVQNLFHKQPLNASKFIPFVLPFLKNANLRKLCLDHNLAELKTIVLKRVNHQLVHKSMMKRLKVLVRVLIDRKVLLKCVFSMCFDRFLSIQSVLEIIYCECMKNTKTHRCEEQKFYNEFVLRVQKMKKHQKIANFELIARVTAMSQDCVMLYSILTQYDKQYETPLYKRFLIGKMLDEGYTHQFYLGQLALFNRQA